MYVIYISIFIYVCVCACVCVHIIALRSHNYTRQCSPRRDKVEQRTRRSSRAHPLLRNADNVSKCPLHVQHGLKDSPKPPTLRHPQHLSQKRKCPELYCRNMNVGLVVLSQRITSGRCMNSLARFGHALHWKQSANPPKQGEKNQEPKLWDLASGP